MLVFKRAFPQILLSRKYRFLSRGVINFHKLLKLLEEGLEFEKKLLTVREITVGVVNIIRILLKLV